MLAARSKVETLLILLSVAVGFDDKMVGPTMDPLEMLLETCCSLMQDGRIKLLELLEHIEEGSRVKEVPFQMKLGDSCSEHSEN